MPFEALSSEPYEWKSTAKDAKTPKKKNKRKRPQENLGFAVPFTDSPYSCRDRNRARLWSFSEEHEII
jgi:hypothetical protein